MTRILIFGHSPLPIENTNKNYAPGKRTWQFVEPLLAGGHEVCLIAFRVAGTYPDNMPDRVVQTRDRLLYHNLSPYLTHDLAYFRQAIEEFRPECIAGIGTLPASVACMVNPDVPVWADLNGAVMTEAQMKAKVYASNEHLRYFFGQEYQVLGRADKISTVSERQRYALIGELGLYGRLNIWTTGYNFAHAIPNRGDAEPYQHTKSVIRGPLTPESNFIVLYSGGYNTWTDVATLFGGLERAMAEDERIVFVSTGGQIDGHDEHTYRDFRKLIAGSAYKQRFHLCGWVPFEDLHNYYLESDVAVIADKYCYEALLGSRTRVLDWLRAELPAIVNPLSEITAALVQDEVAFGFEQGNAGHLAELILSLANDSNRLQSAREKARPALDKINVGPGIAQVFLTWVERPYFAPDHDRDYPRLLAQAARGTEGVPPHRLSWYEVLQPVWSKCIWWLHDSPLRWTVTPLRFLSGTFKRARRALSNL